jgi:hypothetical protein
VIMVRPRKSINRWLRQGTQKRHTALGGMGITGDAARVLTRPCRRYRDAMVSTGELKLKGIAS